jgi:hypothetical protein
VRRNGWGLKTPDTKAPPVSRGERDSWVPVRVCGEVGRGPILMPGQMGSPVSFSIFIFFSSFPFLFFLFLLYLLQKCFKSIHTSF